MKINFEKFNFIKNQNLNSLVLKTTKNVNEVLSFKYLDLNEFYNKKVLIEGVGGSYFGDLQTDKTGIVVTDHNQKQYHINIYDITSILCENKKIVVKEQIKPVDTEHWTQCFNEAKKTTTKGVLHKACKCYENRSNRWESVVKKEIPKEVDSENILLREQLKDTFFGNERKVLLEKDIINHEHENSMSPEEIAKRDEIARGLMKKGKCKIIKGKDKTLANACHRMATWKVLGFGSGHKSQKAAGRDWIHHHGELAGTDSNSMRHNVSKGGYNAMAASYLPGTFHKNNKHQFHQIHKAPGDRRNMRTGARAAMSDLRAHRENMRQYRVDMARTIKNRGKRAELLRNIRAERWSKTPVSQRKPRKSRAKKRTP